MTTKSLAIRTAALSTMALSACLATPAAFAQATFSTTTTCNPVNPPTTFDSVSCTAPDLAGGSVSVSMTAWGYTNTLDATTAKTGWVQGRIGDYNTNGFGAYTGNNESGTDSQHAFDNVTTGCGSVSGADNNLTSTIPLSTANSGCGGVVEAALLTFSSAVSMSKVGVGYVSGDGDMMVWAWTGNGSPTMSSQKLLSSTTGAGSMTGWMLVGTNDFAGPGTWTFSSASVSSSYFLISTYFGATSGSLDMTYADRFKIKTFTVACDKVGCPSNIPGVPEPASLALASLGLMAAVGVRRRSTRKLS